MSSKKVPRRLAADEIHRYLEFALRLANLGGEATLAHFRAGIEVENKAEGGRYDPVTAADRASETAIRAEIARTYPSHGIHGEEQGPSAGAERLTWVVDPIDGTRSFILGQLHWGVLVALNDGRRPVLGVVHQPYVGETFYGSAAGAFLRRNTDSMRLTTRACAKLADACLCSSEPSMFARTQERAAFDLIATKARMVRYGGDCYNYCLLASGLVDLVIESSLHAYDVQAVIPIIEAAGGVMTNWSGGPCYEGGAVIAAGDPELHRHVLEALEWSLEN